MKKYVFLLMTLAVTSVVMANPNDAKKKRYVPKASKIINPKLGMTISNITEAPNNYGTEAKVGFLCGADFRFGKRVYFQPGLFYNKEATMIIYNDGTTQSESSVAKNSLRIKAQAGYYLVNKEGFRFRLNAGPSYDVLLGSKTYNLIVPSGQQVFNSGALNVEAGAGLDIWFLSFDLGYSYGLGNAFSDKFTSGGNFVNSKLVGVYASAGIVIPIQKK
jgi:hypothetical protein